MQRRDFLKCSSAACAGIILSAAVGSGLLSSCASTGLTIMKTSAREGKISIPLASLQDGSFKLIRVKSYAFDIGLQQLEAEKYRALVLVCPHANQPLTRTGNGYYCTLHGSKFAADGAVLKGPSNKPMPLLQTEVSGENLIITL